VDCRSDRSARLELTHPCTEGTEGNGATLLSGQCFSSSHLFSSHKLLFAKALYSSSSEESEARLVGKGFLMNAVHDPDNFLDLLVAMQHRVGAANTTRKFGVLVMELIDLTFNVLESWADGVLFTLGRRKATQSTAADDAEKPAESASSLCDSI
jgi:hypothetical protein